MVNSISIALSGLEAASKKLNASASNIANIQTVGSLEDGKQAPYTPLTTTQTAISDGNGNPLGVRTEYAPKSQPFIPSYEPDSPFANAEGIVGVPNVDLGEEAVNTIFAKLAYKASISIIKAQEELDEELLRAFDDNA
jgi:flagellar basal-body rod protein FlgC